MMEIEYVPLKTPEGVCCGHAKVRSGGVELFLRAFSQGEALILTDSGYFSGTPGPRIRIGGQAEAIAVHERGQLRCCGFPKKSRLSLSDVRARLIAFSAPPRSTAQAAAEPAFGRARPARAEPEGAEAVQPEAGARHACAPEREPSAPRFQAAPERAEPEEAEAEQPRAEARYAQQREEADTERARAFGGDASAGLKTPKKETSGASYRVVEGEETPFDPDVAVVQALNRLATEAAGEFFVSPVPPARQAPPSMECTAADTECFSAMLARTDEVFMRMNASEEDDAVYASPGVQGWRRSVDEMLDPPAARLRTPIQNPFPHIFPGAQFEKELGGSGEKLTGLWSRGGERMNITAIRGEYSPQPPAHLSGFTRYIRAKSGGYWVRVDE